MTTRIASSFVSHGRVKKRKHGVFKDSYGFTTRYGGEFWTHRVTTTLPNRVLEES